MLDGVGVVVSILSAAIKVSGAWEEKGLGKDEVEALSALHKALSGAAGLMPAEAEPGRQELELDRLLIGVFGEALRGTVLVDDLRTLPDQVRRFWAGEASRAHDEVLPQMRTWGSRLATRFRTEKQSLEATLQARLAAARDGEVPTASTGEAPLGLPIYHLLRRAVNDPTLGEPLVPDGDWLSFERDVLYAWQRRLAGREDLRAWLKLGPERDALRLWELVVREQADWGDRHVFGNRRRGEDDGGVRHVALDETYVEPLVKLVKKTHSTAEANPALSTIRQHLEHGPVVVRADFGMGKSLSARRLTRDLSQEWLRSGGKGWLPLYVRCADDLGERRFRKERVLRPALHRVLRGAGLDIAADEVPETERPGSRTLIILDGLDEVELGSRDLQELFKDVAQACGSNRRVLVLSRPGALPYELPERTTLLEVQPLDTDRIGRWLAGWRQVMGAGPDLGGLRQRGLTALAATPILLFMIAWTWSETTEGGDVGAVYERFMRSLAKGKFERDQQRHPVVARAAELLAVNLRSAGHIQTSDPVDAMLWFLARAAWEARCLAHARPLRDLDTQDLGNLIREVAPRLESGALDAVRLGVLLAMQIDPHGGTARVFFGHRSFAEYLCARFWEMRLERGMQRRRDEREIALLGRAPLAMRRQEEDRALEFLLGRLGRWETAKRQGLQGWALDLLRDPPGTAPFHEEFGWPLRRSMLTVASSLEGWAGWEVSEAEAPILRALSSWRWVVQWQDRLVARGLRAREGVRLAIQEEPEADLTDANLSGAILFRANLYGANLSGAILNSANLNSANLNSANLNSANLYGARLSGARLSGADLFGADLFGADLFGANLSGARLSGANLSEARLSGANLSGARLSGANLSGARLSGANLSGADLTNASFHLHSRTHWDATTIWPDGFTPPPFPESP